MVFYAGLAHFENPFQQRHRQLGAKARAKAQRVFKVVLTALTERDARQFRVRLLIVGYRRHGSGVEGAHHNSVLQPRAHGMTGKAFDIADYDIGYSRAESAL